MTGTLDSGHQRVLADRYELNELIGAGGAARVYVAVDRQLGRRVAVKLLGDTAARSADPAARERFLLESRTAAAFDHPNVITVYDAGVDRDDLFLVMEHVDGKTLAEHVAVHGPLPVAEALALACQVADGLAAAHVRGIVHRDVKGANVLVDGSGRAVLTDFGIAKRLDEIESALTSDGMIVGTPAYLAPEQATGGRLTSATDVYALGVLLNEMLTGWRPHGESAATAWRQAPFDPRTRRPDVPTAVAEIVLRSTDPDPARRFADAGELSAALAGIRSRPQALAQASGAAPLAAQSSRGGTATMHVADAELATAVLSPPEPDRRGTTGRLPLIVLAAAAVAVAGLVMVAQRAGRDDVVTTPIATTVPVAANVPATVPAALTAPPAAPPTTAANVEAPDPGPAEGNGNNGNGNGRGNNGNGNGRGRGGG